MRKTSAALALALALAAAPLAAADRVVYTRPQASGCGMGCMDALTELTFGDVDKEADYYAGLVGSTYFMTSLVACVDAYCSEAERTAAWRKFTEQAWKYGPEVAVPPMDGLRASTNGTPPLIDVLDESTHTPIYNNTVNVTPASARAGYLTEREWDLQMIYHHAYGWAMYVLLAVMLAVGMVHRAWAFYATSRPLRDAEALAPLPATGPASRLHAWYRAHIAVPATFGYRHIQPWGIFSIPTRLEAIFIFIYVALNFIWSCTNYHLFDENLYWPNDRKLQLARYIADRTGIMAFYNLPLLWLFAGRNDVLMWLTGWSYPACNLMHRWAARIATLHAIVHSICYTWIEVHHGVSLATMFAQQYWATGVFATVGMSILLPLSIRPLREKLYETFLMLHIALALAVLVLLFYHVKIFGTDYNGYLWACVAVWAFDRLARLVRVGVLSFNAFHRGEKNTLARITYDTPTGLIRLSVTAAVRITPKPGQYYFLYTPASLTPWENHPFTLASWSAGARGTTLNFLAKPYNGATKKLRRRVAAAHAAGAPALPMTVLLEGPYGHTHPAEAYDRLLLVAGGSGITALLPYVNRLARGEHAVRSITVVWVVRTAAYAGDVLANELAPEHLGAAAVHVYATQDDGTPAAAGAEKPPLDSPPATSGSSAEGSFHKDAGDKPAKPLAGAHTIVPGRPSMAALVAAEIAALVGSERLAVLACGPGGMMDDLRRAVARSYGPGDAQVAANRLEYYEEAFGW